MKIAWVTMITLLFSAAQAFAYADKTYECKNLDGLPKNTYKFTTLSIAPGVTLPYVEIHRFYRLSENQEIKESTIRGYATIIKTDPGYEVLQIAALRLEFDGDNLLSCRQ